MAKKLTRKQISEGLLKVEIAFDVALKKEGMPATVRSHLLENWALMRNVNNVLRFQNADDLNGLIQRAESWTK